MNFTSSKELFPYFIGNKNRAIIEWRGQISCIWNFQVITIDLYHCPGNFSMARDNTASTGPADSCENSWIAWRSTLRNSGVEMRARAYGEVPRVPITPTPDPGITAELIQGARNAPRINLVPLIVQFRFRLSRRGVVLTILERTFVSRSPCPLISSLKECLR